MEPENPEAAERPVTPQPPPGWSAAQPPPFGATTPSTPTTAGEPGPAVAPGPAGGPTPPPNKWQPPPPAPQPGVVPLRPLLVADIITGAVEYVRRYPKAVIGISAIVGLAVAFGQLALLATGLNDLQSLSDPETLTEDQLLEVARGLLVVAVVQSVVIALLQVLGTGMLAHVMGRAVIGQSTTFEQAWSLVRPQIWRLVGASVAVALIVIAGVVAPLVPAIVVLAAGAGQLAAGLALLGGIASLAVGIWLSFRLVLTTPAVALEDLGIGAGLRRSWRLVGGAFWRTLGIVLLGVVLGQAVGAILAAPLNLLAGSGGDLSTGSVFALALAAMITMVVALPFIAGVTTLVYIDRRIRTENLAGVLQAAAEQQGTDKP